MAASPQPVDTEHARQHVARAGERVRAEDDERRDTATNVSRRFTGCQDGVQPRLRSSACPASSSPWIAPQTTNVQAAPCHSPPSNITIARLRASLSGRAREPPSGMKR